MGRDDRRLMAQTRRSENTPSAFHSENKGFTDMMASPLAIWLTNPASVLLVAPDDDGSPIPYVRRIRRADYWRSVGYQRGYNRLRRAGLVAPVEGLRFDPTASRLLETAYTWRGARWLLAHPMLAVGLVLTQGGSDWLERDMRQIFVDRRDADQAAETVARTFEGWRQKQRYTD